MSYLDALLIAEATASGRAQRSALFRHRHLTKKPLGMLFWQLGAEPFTAAAVAWGFGAAKRDMVVAGEPRDRELAFRALGRVARAFNPWFEGAGTERPQLIVPNRGNLALIGRLGRRLAYLSERRGFTPDPELVRFGKHLRFLAEHARMPGQQLVVVATDLLASHWVTGLSDLEVQNLSALDAAIDPPKGRSLDETAFDAERLEIGPVPGLEDDKNVDKLLAKFNEKRGRGAGGRFVTDERIIEPLLAPFRAHYTRLVDRGWALLWRCVERERSLPPAPSVTRRWAQDLKELDRHVAWVVEKTGRYRTRATNVQAARRLSDWEKAHRLVEAEEIVEDPLRMVACLLKHEALSGRVAKLDLAHREMQERQMAKRPLVWVDTDDECLMPVGKELFWTKTPAAAAWRVETVTAKQGGARVLLKRLSGRDPDHVPKLGERVVFSVHTTKPDGYLAPMPAMIPWTHRKRLAETSTTIEDGEGRPWE